MAAISKMLKCNITVIITNFQSHWSWPKWNGLIVAMIFVNLNSFQISIFFPVPFVQVLSFWRREGLFWAWKLSSLVVWADTYFLRNQFFQSWSRGSLLFFLKNGFKLEWSVDLSSGSPLICLSKEEQRGSQSWCASNTFQFWYILEVVLCNMLTRCIQSSHGGLVH